MAEKPNQDKPTPKSRRPRNQALVESKKCKPHSLVNCPLCLKGKPKS